MKYKDIDGWELDYENELVLLKVNGKTVDTVTIDDLIENWLEDMANQEFGPIEDEDDQEEEEVEE